MVGSHLGLLLLLLLVADANNCNAMSELLCGFFVATGGANWTYANGRAPCDPPSTPNSTSYCWCATPDPCTWWQVECTRDTCANSAVSELVFPANTGLVGALPPTLGYALASLAASGEKGFATLSLQNEAGLGVDLMALKGLTTLTTLQLTGSKVTAALGALDDVLGQPGPAVARSDRGKVWRLAAPCAHCHVGVAKRAADQQWLLGKLVNI